MKTLEAGQSVGLGGRGRRGSAPHQEDGHTGFRLVDFGGAGASRSVRAGGEVGLAAATSEVEIRVKRRVGGNDPRSRPPFFQGVRSLDPSFYLLS